MKSFAVAMLAASSVSAFNTDFISGAQKGFFLESEKQIKDFKCQPAEVSNNVQKVVSVVNVAEMMMKSVKKGAAKTSNPTYNLAIDAVTSYGKISYLLDAEYEGSQFCKGLLLAHEFERIVTKLGRKTVSKQSEYMLQ